MSREWVDDAMKRPRDKRWVMRCDVIHPSGQRCRTEGEPSPTQPDLETYSGQGWYIAAVHGDICPACLAAGYVPSAAPHPLMSKPPADG